jgi:putative membrane protein
MEKNLKLNNMKKIILSVMVMTAIGMSAQTVSKKDEAFVKDAAHAGLLEVKLGELAVSRASSADVKELGQHMVTDHTKANNELKALASKKSIPVPGDLDKEGQMHYDELSKKSGADFDKAYSALMVKDHKKVIAKFKEESSSGNDKYLAAWASATLPTLQHHLMMSEETDSKINKK